MICSWIPSPRQRKRICPKLHRICAESPESWLAHSRRVLTGKIKIEGARDVPTLKDERIPTKVELRRIFLSGDKKARVACVLVLSPQASLPRFGVFQTQLEAFRVSVV